jgi:hypothetical protein
MIVALDPNVIIVALCHRGSHDLLFYLWDSNSRDLDRAVRIARDNEGVLRNEYNRCLQQRLQQDPESLVVSFLQDLLSQWEAWSIVKASDLCDGASNFLSGNGCTSKPEPQLIALAANSDVLLGTVDPDVNHPGLQPRVIIRTPGKVGSLCQHLPQFQVIYSTEAVAFLEYKFLSTMFEGKVESWVRRQYRYPHVKHSADLPYLKKTAGAGEVDVLAFDYQCNPRRVLVCECKLRMPQKGSKLVNEEEVAQLVTTWQVVKDHEEQKARDEGYGVQVFQILVSNAEGITEQALVLARKYGVEIRRAVLPQDWHRYTNWEIDRCERVR